MSRPEDVAGKKPAPVARPGGHGAMAGRVPSIEQVASVYRKLADAYSQERASATHERTWQRIELKRSLEKKRGFVPRARVRWAGYSLAALALSALLGWFAWSSEDRIEYALEGAALQDGWIVPVAQGATLTFTDGSRLQLAEGSALSVDALGPHAALSRLARGRIHVQVEHHDDTRWTFLAGPYEVRVEGTAFDLSWSNERFALQMHEGRVRVVGPDQEEWVLKAGDGLTVPAPAEHAAVAEQAGVVEQAGGSAASAELAPDEPAATEPGTTEPGAAAASPLSPSAGATPKTARSDWKRLLKAGRFDDVVAEAKAAGVQQVLANRPASDVETLAQAARYTGDAALAERCWKAIRSRAPGSSAARQSAFFLGRVMEQQGRHADAIQWFAKYREESPGGVFAGQALGRQMVLTRGESARALARDYLARHPDGPYAKAARGVLGEKAAGVSGRDDALSAE